MNNIIKHSILNWKKMIINYQILLVYLLTILYLQYFLFKHHIYKSIQDESFILFSLILNLQKTTHLIYLFIKNNLNY